MNNRILFILHLPPPVHGAGVMGEFIRTSNLINRSFEAKFINLSTSRSMDDLGKGGFLKLLRYISLIFRSFLVSLFFRPKIVYMTMAAVGLGFYKDAVIVLFLKLIGKKFVFHFHNKGIANRQHRKFDNWLYKNVLRNSKVILLAPQLKSDVEKYVKDEDIFFCPNGIRSVSSLKSWDSEKIIRLLFIGNLTETKGILVLLSSLELLKSKNVPFHCDIIGGEGAMTGSELLKRIDTANLNRMVSYRGKVFGEEKEDFLKNADILVHPSLEEAFGLVILEAMDFSLPVVATLEGGIPHIVRDNITGFLIPKGDPEALARSLEILISDKTLRVEFGKRGNERFLAEFTLDIFEKNITGILDAIAKKPYDKQLN